MSLIKELNEWIKDQGFVSYEEIEAFCRQTKYKISNAERRLRPSESPCVEAVMAKKESGGKYVYGYRYKPPTSFEKALEKHKQKRSEEARFVKLF